MRFITVEERKSLDGLPRKIMINAEKIVAIYLPDDQKNFYRILMNTGDEFNTMEIYDLEKLNEPEKIKIILPGASGAKGILKVEIHDLVEIQQSNRPAQTSYWKGEYR